MPAISLDNSQKIAEIAFAEGANRGVTRLSVVVTDVGGDIRVAMRADEQGSFGVDTARAKAQTALGFRMSSHKLNAFFGSNPTSTIGIAAATKDRFFPVGGGIVIVDESGEIVGAAAVSGGAPEVDDAIIRAAVTAIGFGAMD
jgi:uncharacterized protein GlcG (DUF336 family)